MALADDLVQAVAEWLAFGDGPRPDPPTDTQVLRDYWPDASEVVVVVLDKLCAAGLTMFSRGGFGDRIEIGELASAVERGEQHGD